MSGGSEVGRVIGELRKAKGLTLPDLADAAGISKGYLWTLETHWSHRPDEPPPNPGLDLLARLAESLEVTVADLIGSEATLRTVSGGQTPLPVGLSEFLSSRAKKGRPVPDDAVDSLASVKLRGRRPQTVEEWAAIYDAWEQTLGRGG
jgi:transcriptional regulator with XRE-family HTH domain